MSAQPPFRVMVCMKNLFSGKYALLANTLSGGILFAIGDTIEQKLEIRRGVHNHFNWARLGRISIIGLTQGPPHHYFYKYLDRWYPGTSKVMILKKILLDQIIASPFFNVQFIMGMGLMEGKTLNEAWNEFLFKFPRIYIWDWIVWPPCQYVNFFYLSPKYRVLCVNGVTVFWNVFLSYSKHYDEVY